jgi:ribosomal protein S18 acetylase RimI-like enzyme
LLDYRIQEYLRFSASSGREVEQIGPFLATFTPHDTNLYLNYAIPDVGATPSPADVSSLVGTYRERSRKPRLEYITKLAPNVEEALLDNGFVAEGRLPLMVCTPGSELAPPTPEGIELIVPASDEEMLALINVQSEAYGGEPTTDPQAITHLRASLLDGGIAVLARAKATGEPAGAGVCTVPHKGMTEVAGIGVRPNFRRRGIAAALTVRLAQEAFASGVSLAFLMAIREAEAQIYTRAGFSQVGDILHISLPEE